jgi:K+-sensing histidine kinase KdpD
MILEPPQIYGNDNKKKTNNKMTMTAAYFMREEILATIKAQLVEQSAYYGARVPTEVVQEELAPPFWFFDLRLVRLAMDAALDNAWRFAQTRVELSARVTEGYLVLTVEDDGPGLQNPQLHPSATSDWSTGLGCQLGAAVARAHEHAGRFGRAELMNRHQGGARFELWLP